MKTRRQLITFLSLFALAFAACSSSGTDSTDVTLECSLLTVGSEQICVANKALQETGFKCPPSFASFHQYGLLLICTKTGYLPIGTDEELKKKYKPEELPDTSCRAIPTCKSGDAEYTSKEECDKQGKCYEVTVCGTTIICGAPQAQCLAMPVCKQGETEVKDSSDCLQDDAVCYQNSMCGVTIWCTGPSGPISCPEGSVTIHGDDCVVDDNSCYMLSESTWCDNTREPASGTCIKNAGDSCTKDSDCVAGGCGGELCYNKDSQSGISTCECTQQAGINCGCVNGKCGWWKPK